MHVYCVCPPVTTISMHDPTTPPSLTERAPPSCRPGLLPDLEEALGPLRPRPPPRSPQEAGGGVSYWRGLCPLCQEGDTQGGSGEGYGEGRGGEGRGGEPAFCSVSEVMPL